jgi:hypothetical protein
MSNSDAIATWENLGSSALDVTQGTAGARPTYNTTRGTVSQPCLSFDGGDWLRAATASDWNFLHREEALRIEAVGAVTSVASIRPILGSRGTSTTGTGVNLLINLTNSRFSFSAAVAGLTNHTTSSTTSVATNLEDVEQWSAERNLSGTDELRLYENSATSYYNVNISPTWDTSTDATNPMTIGSYGSGASAFWLGHMFQLRIYNAELDATQRAINLAVDNWLLSGTMPVTP